MDFDITTLLGNLLSQFQFNPETPMLFSSGLFWLLFIIFLPIYAFLKSKRNKMVLFVIAFSLYFYYKSSGMFFLMLTATSLVDWFISRAIYAARTKTMRLLLMWLSISLSLSILGYFKYVNFFMWNWHAMIGGNFQPLDIILPVGISFYTFQSISYVIDVYKERITPTSSWLEYLFYLSFFPQLVAGPIVRADYFLPQLCDNKPASREMIYYGFWLILLGVIKKAIIADYIAQYNDLIFNNPTGYGGVESLMAIVGYTMQIYCDFSGYSDMAIGLALIMGFHLGENFRLPYQSKNITEFWRRWHISLSSWLRDYVYIPLGGNRKGKVRTYINLLTTMLVGGLWHGAAWKFVFWGGMHGAGLVVHKLTKPILDRIPNTWFIKTLSWLATITFVSLLWVFFRAASFEDAVAIIGNVFTNFNVEHLLPFFNERATWCAMMLIIIISHIMPLSIYERLGRLFVCVPWIVKLCVFCVVVQLVIQFMSADVAPFIYFQF